MTLGPSLDQMGPVIEDLRKASQRAYDEASSWAEEAAVWAEESTLGYVYGEMLEALEWIDENIWQPLSEIQFKCDTDLIRSVADKWGTSQSSPNPEVLETIASKLGSSWTSGGDTDLTDWEGKFGAGAQEVTGRAMSALLGAPSEDLGEARKMPEMGNALNDLADEFEYAWADMAVDAAGVLGVGLGVVGLAAAIASGVGIILALIALVVGLVALVISLMVRYHSKQSTMEDVSKTFGKLLGEEPNFANWPW